MLLAWWSSPKCDPRASGLVSADDQMLPAYVLETAGHLHGVPGLFIAGIFGAALRLTIIIAIYATVSHLMLQMITPAVHYPWV